MPNRVSVSACVSIFMMLSTACRSATPTLPLAAAAIDGRLDQIRSLLAAGADANQVDPATGNTSLALAARAAQIEAIRALVNGGADPNLPSGHNEWTPLLHAIHKDRLASVEALIAAGADVNRAVGWGFAPLMMAVGNGNEAIVDFLLAAGADPAAQLGDGTTVLALAISGGALTDIERPLLGRCHTAIVDSLLRREPNLRVGTSTRTRLARWLAGLNGCDQVLRLVDTR